MADTTCGHCGRLAHMPAASDLRIIPGPAGSPGGTRTAAYGCPNCLRLNVATQWVANRGSLSGIRPVSEAAVAQWSDDAEWIPRLGERREFPDVPQHIADAASEATLCLSLGAYRAAGALARAVVEATAKDKGAEGKDLYNRIEALHEADHIRKHTKEQAHEVRHFGNGMAHGDFADPVEKEEAEEVIDLMAEVLDEVYQSPARLAKRKEARLAKKGE